MTQARVNQHDAQQVLTDAVHKSLEKVRVLLQSHAGDLQVVEVTPEGDVTLAFEGTCVNCPAQAMTVGATIMPAVEKVDGVRNIHLKSMNLSPAAVRRIREMFGN